jgi:pSer/pThr/pTyr-binding forkhead associated (FHA) protein
MDNEQPCLEMGGRRISLTPAFKVGRSKRCSLTLDDSQASREHALIAHDEGRGAWLVMDLGSTNGTRLNGSLIGRPTVLSSGDRIGIGSHELTFLDTTPTLRGNTTVSTRATMVRVHSVSRWLLLGDIKGSTRLWREQPEDLPPRLRDWILECTTLIERSGGWINEYLGDGFLAAWRTEDQRLSKLVDLLQALEALQPRGGIDFRFVAHFARLQSGAAVSSGLEKLSGPELNFLFKAEKVVAAWNRRLILTDAAANRLADHLPLEPAGEIVIQGFDGARPAFAPRRP